MSDLAFWLTAVVMGIVTYGLRLSFITLLGRVGSMPVLVERALRLVPAAVLTALVTPALLYRADAVDISLGNERLLAGVVAAVVAWRTRSPALTIVVGMVALWALKVFVELS